MSVIDITTLLVLSLFGVECLPHQDTSLGVVGGHAVNITEVPFMARYYSLRIGYRCQGAIVHEKFVLTSGLCNLLYSFAEDVSYVLVGTDDPKRGSEWYDVELNYIHPSFTIYNNTTTDYDIALLKLAKPLKFSDRVRPISLADKGFVVPAGAMFDIVGFGFMDASFQSVADRLQTASVPYVPREKCSNVYSNLTDRMICADGEGKGSCMYDSGGPLVYKNKLLGVVSYAFGCGQTNFPTVYSYIPVMRDFIDKVINTKA